jgi:adenosylcobyric acid synthase
MSGVAPCLMVQGTASGVGKSLLAAAFCRIFARAGYRVAPFKSQNMALNAAVTFEGGEIGRAQAAQAAAAGIEPTVDMNPILLKPEPGYRSQVVVRGRAVARVSWPEYQRMQAELLPVVAESLARLRRAWDLVIIEGAGSPAEINLRDSDIVNMTVARMADAPVVLVGDIDRGGVFAALLGTLALLDSADRARVGGLIVNRFRGDATVLAAGLTELAARAGVPVLGVVPYLDASLVPAEDSLDLDEPSRWGAPGALDIAVVRLPHIANFDDFEPLAAEPGVAVRFVRGPDEIRRADVIVLPGSKSTVCDLHWLFASGFAPAILGAAADGRPIVGICGGY